MHREAFLSDILEHSDDDAPRLIYADWLDDHGDDNDRLRAEFIRVQCRLAALPPHGDEALALADRAEDLLVENRKAWEKPLGKLVSRCAFHRGFISSIDVKYSDFLDKGDQLFALAPIRAVRFLGRFSTSRKIRQLIDSPHLVRLSSVDFSEAIAFDPPAALDLSRTKKASGLTGLNLASNRLGSEGMQSLASSPHLAGLKDLNLRSNNLGTKGVMALTSASTTFRLNKLNMSLMRIYSSDIALLANSESLAGVTDLDLNGNEVGMAGLRSLANSTRMQLRSLMLERHTVGDPRWGREAAELIACCPNFGQLEALGLRNHAIGDRGLAALASSPLVRLRSLAVGCNEITAAGLAALVESPNAERLTSLNLYTNVLGENAMDAVADSPYLSNLLELHLQGCRIGDPGAKALARSPHLTRLRSLALDGNLIGPEGATALAESPYLNNLRRLSIDHNPLTTESRNKLAARFGRRALGLAGRS